MKKKKIVNKYWKKILLAVFVTSVLWGISHLFVIKKPVRVLDSYSSIQPQIIPIDLLSEYQSIGGLIAADVNDDGKHDLLITRPGYVGVYSSSGHKFWSKQTEIQVAGRSDKQGLPGWLGAGVQVGDIDGDRQTEVLYLTKDNSLQIIQGNNGKVKYSISLPDSPPNTERWEHLVIANFRGKGDRDLLLQTTNIGDYRWGKYLAAYSIEELIKARQPKPLWTRDNFAAAAHNGAKVADLDLDGRDEVISGEILNSQGETIYTLPIKRAAEATQPHIDSIAIADVRPKIPGLEVVFLEESSGTSNNVLNTNNPHLSRLLRIGNRILFNKPWLWAADRVFLYSTSGGLKWQTHYKYQEAQNTAVGNFVPNRSGLEIWCRSRYDENQQPFVFDARGKLISHYQMKQVAPSDWSSGGVDVIYTIDWTGKPKQLAAARERNGKNSNIVIFDPISGEFLYRFSTQADVLYVADVTDDWREEIIVLESDRLLIYSNPESNPNPQHPSLWSQPHYQRNKTNWNYYSP